MQSLPTDIVGTPFSLRHLSPTREIAMVLFDVFQTDFDNMRFWLRGKKIESVDEVFDGIKRAYECDNMYMYYILDKDQIVGEIGFSSIKKKTKIVNVDYWLTPSVRGRKLIDDLLPLVENLAFDNLKMDKVLLKIDACNTASRKIAEKNGYTLDGIMRDERMWPDGSFHDECEYSKLKSEWVKENKNA